MKLGVLGLWHLGTVTAACTATAGIPTIAVDDDAAVVAGLGRGEPPLFEPGLKELLAAGMASGKLGFTADPAALADVDVVWVCYDTPVDEEDRADAAQVIGKIEAIYPHLRDGAIVLVSSQLPVGTIANLERSFLRVAAGRSVFFACSPENLRLGSAIESFINPGRIVIGARDPRVREVLRSLLARFCHDLIWMRVESAEMAKHALNSFLAVSVAFTNELAAICEVVGAEAGEVETALRSDPRVGKAAYVRAGPAFAGGTLARDVRFLLALSEHHRIANPLIASVIASNELHRQWSIAQLRRRLAPFAGKTVALLGLAYKPGTDAIRRSMAIELLVALTSEGARVRAFDPAVRRLPGEFVGSVELAADPKDAMLGTAATVVATAWPEFRSLSADDFVTAMTGNLVLDPARVLQPTVYGDKRLTVVSIGSPA